MSENKEPEINRAQDFKPVGRSAAAVRRLHELAFQLDASQLTFEQVLEALEAGRETLYQPSARVARAIDKVVPHVVTEAGERLAKAYNVVQHNSTGMEQERLLVLTTRGFYRVFVDYEAVDRDAPAEECVRKCEFMAWPGVQVVCFGFFTYASSIIPSLAQFTLKDHIDHLYGIRVLPREKPAPPSLPLPPTVDRFVDSCFRTYRPMSIDGPADGEDVKEWRARDREHLIEVTGELFSLISLCIRTCPVIRAMADIDGQQPQYYNPVAYTRGGLSVSVMRGVVSTIYNKLGRGFAKPPADGAAAAAAAPAPAAAH